MAKKNAPAAVETQEEFEQGTVRVMVHHGEINDAARDPERISFDIDTMSEYHARGQTSVPVFLKDVMYHVLSTGRQVRRTDFQTQEQTQQHVTGETIARNYAWDATLEMVNHFRKWFQHGREQYEIHIAHGGLVSRHNLRYLLGMEDVAVSFTANNAAAWRGIETLTGLRYTKLPVMSQEERQARRAADAPVVIDMSAAASAAKRRKADSKKGHYFTAAETDAIVEDEATASSEAVAEVVEPPVKAVPAKKASAKKPSAPEEEVSSSEEAAVEVEEAAVEVEEQPVKAAPAKKASAKKAPVKKAPAASDEALEELANKFNKK